MTLLAATDPEPLGDIAAQFGALVDPGHPKRALWISLGTRMPMVPAFDDLARLTTPVGWLFAAPRLLLRLKADASEEMLSRILDYHEPKPYPVRSELPVVQALDLNGWVVQEMLSSWSRVGEARRRAAAYGVVRVVSIAACLERRRWLIGRDNDRVRAALTAVVVKRENKDRR
jgi:hypothetical protein